MRLFFRPHASADIGAIVTSAAFILAWAGGCVWGRAYWGDWFPGAAWVIPAALAGYLALQSASRRPFLRAWASLTSPIHPPMERSGVIKDSEAEREVRTDDDGTALLSREARYLVRIQLDGGSRVTCELPLQVWTRLRVGQRVRLQTRGTWLLGISAEDGP